MGGDVAVESAPGVGSTFTVTLTLHAALADSPLKTLLRPVARTSARVDARPGESPRVLVVEDHPVNREVLVLQLELLGIAADSVENGVDALEAWARGRYAAVLADIHMPTWMAMSWRGGCAPPKPTAAPFTRRSLRSLPTP